MASHKLLVSVSCWPQGLQPCYPSKTSLCFLSHPPISQHFLFCRTTEAHEGVQGQPVTRTITYSEAPAVGPPALHFSLCSSLGSPKIHPLMAEVGPCHLGQEQPLILESELNLCFMGEFSVVNIPLSFLMAAYCRAHGIHIHFIYLNGI